MKDHVSPSQIGTFRQCPTLWAYTALDGRRQPPSGAAHLGSSFHKAAEAHNRVKLGDHVGLSPDQITDAYAQSFSATPASEIQWGEESEGETFRAGAQIVRLFGITAARDIQPSAVEVEVSVPVEGDGLPVLCRLDLVDDKNRVIDFKTTGKAPSEDSADDSEQLTAYSAAHAAKYDRLPTGVVLDYFVKPTKGYPTGRRIPVLGTRNESQVAIWRRDVAAITSQMRHAESTGLIPYADPSSWKCSAKWCGFFQECPGGAARRAILPTPATVIAFPSA